MQVSPNIQTHRVSRQDFFPQVPSAVCLSPAGEKPKPGRRGPTTVPPGKRGLPSSQPWMYRLVRL